MAEVKMTLPADSIRRLPEGASFRAKSGRASVEVSKGSDPGTIVVYASCDSLQRLVDYYERQVDMYLSALDEARTETVEAEKKPSGRRRLYPVILAVGMMAGIAITLKMKK